MLSDSCPKQVQLSERERISLMQSKSVAGGNGICSCAALKVMLHKAIDQIQRIDAATPNARKAEAPVGGNKAMLTRFCNEAG